MMVISDLRAIAVLLFALPALAAVAQDPESYDDLDQPMNFDPELFIPPPISVFEPELATLWTGALSAPDADARRRAAETMVEARRLGMEGLEIAIADLVRLANDSDERPLVRFAALRALVAIDAQSEAETILATALFLGPDAEADALDALAKWNYKPAIDVWRARLQDTRTSSPELLLAIRGLEASKDTQDTKELRTLTVERFKLFDVRLAAARALAELQYEGLEEGVSQLLAGDKPNRRQRMLAAALLRHHSGEAAEQLLEKLALDSEPAVADLALTRLIEIAPARIAKHQSELLSSRDANVRRWTVQALAQFPSEEHTVVLARVTNDPNPGIRVLARNTLLAYANEHNLRDAVLREADKLLVETDWRAIEQACRLVGSLDHKPAAPQLVKILPHERIEAHATAAWALRRLAVPETLPDVLEFAKATTDQAMEEVRLANLTRNYDPLLSQVFQFFGQMRYTPADPVLRRYIPKMSMQTNSRSSAIWALGYLHQENPPQDLLDALEDRLLDVGTIPPEQVPIRRFSAVSLGRMKATSKLPTLRRFYAEAGPYTPPSYACGWAIEQLTGEPVAIPVAPKEYVQGWFLSPLK